MGKIVFVGLFEVVALDGRTIPAPIEWAMFLSEGAKEAIEEEKADSEVVVIAAVVVQGTVMNIVQPAGVVEPGAQTGRTLHPESLKVHAVVQVAEHEEWPCQQSGQRQQL